MRRANILLVDDDRNFLKVLTHSVQLFEFSAVPVHSAKQALDHLKEEEFDLVITDLRMPGMDGLELVSRTRKSHPDMPVIVLTAYGAIDTAVEAVKRGAFDFITKPFEKEEMRHVISNALKMADLVEENRRLSRFVRKSFEFEGIPGSSRKFREVLDLAEQLAAVDTTVLILGESGTGKELLARAIHFNSRRRNRPFVVVNCGAIPEDLIESELFGHRKGAFTGAVTDRKGKFETADSGTIFLDEIGDLTPGMQVGLLRVIQERQIDVVGDPHPRPVDVRILAATNRDLRKSMEEGKFRDDLYYRLSVAPLHLPPLRERPEDVPVLAHHFLQTFNQKFGKDVNLEESAIESLQRYEWPGNVRELENIVERQVVFDRRGTITRQDLPSHFRHPVRSIGKIILQLPDDGFSLEEVERDILLAALERHQWNQTHAAQYLGITRNTLIYRMHKYDLGEVGAD